jgi:hypothetical protein
VKSLQSVLNEFILHNKLDYTVTASALSQAKQKLKHTAFVELNDDTVSFYYRDNDIKRIRGFRCLGMDASQIILPNTKEIKEAFGAVAIKNGAGNDLGEYSSGLFQCCYDLFNRIAVKTSLNPGNSYEIDLAIEMLPSFNEKDLLIFDRAYLSFPMLIELAKAGCQYIIRCKRNGFKKVHTHFKRQGPWSKIVRLTAPKDRIKELEALGLPTEISVRLVRVVLSTGEIEVLATSLRDTEIEKYSREFFKEIYGLRWGVETFFFVCFIIKKN